MDREQSRPAIRVAVAAPFAQLVRIHERAAEYADEIELCAAISDATRVLEQTRRLQPEVLLLSEEFGFDDAEFFTQLNAVAPATRLVLLVGGDAGARSFADAVVSSEAAAVELRAVIVSVARGIDPDPAPPAQLRGGLPAVVEAAVESDATRRFSAMHDPSPTPPIGIGNDDDGAPAFAPVAEDTGAQSQSQGPASVAQRRATGAGPERPARVAVVFSGKGGVGKSVVAANLATALVVSGSRATLVDLDLQYGDAGLLLQLESHATTIDALAALAAVGGLDAQHLQAGLATTTEGLRVLLAPRSPELADAVSVQGLGVILTELARTCDYLVVDTPAHLEERILGVMEAADHVLLVTSSSIAAVKDTKMTLRLLQSLGIEPGRVGVIVNHTTAKVGFSTEDIERALRFPLLATLPFEPRMHESIDGGRPLVLSEPRSGFSKQLQLVIAHLARERAAPAGGTPRARPVRWRRRFSPR